MKTTTILLVAALAALLVAMSGCGLVSGTVFISQKVDGRIEAQSGTAVAATRARDGLDEIFGGAKVDLRNNSDWQDIDVDGIEDICVRLTAINLLNQNVSGEAWVTVGEDSAFTSIAQIQAAGGFRIFSGLYVGPQDTVIFTCGETLDLFENLDKLADAVKEGVFWVWGRGDQDVYHIKYEAIYLGIHVTGSL